MRNSLLNTNKYWDNFARTKSRELNVNEGDIRNKIRDILQRKGVVFKEKTVHIPLDNALRKRLRKVAAVYSKKNFDSAVDFLFAKNVATPSSNTIRMAEKVYQILQNQVKGDNFPNFSMFQKDVMFTGRWTRL